jgi:hypothetical protein
MQYVVSDLTGFVHALFPFGTLYPANERLLFIKHCRRFQKSMATAKLDPSLPLCVKQFLAKLYKMVRAVDPMALFTVADIASLIPNLWNTFGDKATPQTPSPQVRQSMLPHVTARRSELVLLILLEPFVPLLPTFANVQPLPDWQMKYLKDIRKSNDCCIATTYAKTMKHAIRQLTEACEPIADGLQIPVAQVMKLDNLVNFSGLCRSSRCEFFPLPVHGDQTEVTDEPQYELKAR